MTPTLARHAPPLGNWTRRPLECPDCGSTIEPDASAALDVRAALRELEDAAFNLGAGIDASMGRYSAARATLYALLGLSLEDLT